MGVTIIGSGKAMPKRSVTNDELSEFIDTDNQWIVERTGIHERAIAVEESGTELGVNAVRSALGMSPGGWQAKPGIIDPESIDLILCSTYSPDMLIPSQAALIKAKTGLSNAIAFDVNAACTGCVYGTEIISSMISAGSVSEAGSHKRNPLKRAVLVCSERLSHLLNWEDRSTCVLFGDGAGAIVFEWDDEKPGIMGSFLKNTDDEDGALLSPNVFDLSTFPFDDDNLIADDGIAAAVFPGTASNDDKGKAFQGDRLISMNGQKVFKFATASIIEALDVAAKRAGITTEDIDCIVAHQANERIIRYAAKKLDVPIDDFQISIGTMGNTSSASVPMALTDAYVSKRIKSGDIVALIGFGGGFTAGAIIFRSE